MTTILLPYARGMAAVTDEKLSEARLPCPLKDTHFVHFDHAERDDAFVRGVKDALLAKLGGGDIWIFMQMTSASLGSTLSAWIFKNYADYATMQEINNLPAAV